PRPAGTCTPTSPRWRPRWPPTASATPRNSRTSSPPGSACPPRAGTASATTSKHRACGCPPPRCSATPPGSGRNASPRPSRWTFRRCAARCTASPRSSTTSATTSGDGRPPDDATVRVDDEPDGHEPDDGPPGGHRPRRQGRTPPRRPRTPRPAVPPASRTPPARRPPGLDAHLPRRAHPARHAPDQAARAPQATPFPPLAEPRPLAERRVWPRTFHDRLTAPLPGLKAIARFAREGAVRPDRAGLADIPRLPYEPGPLPRVDAGTVAVTWAGHASWVVRIGGLTVLTDPVWSRRILGTPARVTPVGVAWDALPRVDAVVVSHNHYDHLDAPTLRRLPRDTPVFVPAGLGRWFQRRRFTRVTELDWWEAAELPPPGGGPGRGDAVR